MGDLSLTGQIPHFLQAYLSKPASALPKGAFWVVDFSDLSNATTGVKQAILRTARLEPNSWEVESGFNCLVDTADYKSKGCLFCQAVSVPGEQAIVNPEGIQKSHFIRTATGDGRADYAPGGLKMVFLDTNVSFVDNVIRPWVVTTARLGMIARPDGISQYRGTITVYKLGVLTHDKPPFILQKYTFYGVCPVEVSSEEYNYAPATAPVSREATFVFHSYKLQTNINNLAISNNTEQTVKKVGPLTSHKDVATVVIPRQNPAANPAKPKPPKQPKPKPKPPKPRPPKPRPPRNPSPKPKPPAKPPQKPRPQKPRPPKKDGRPSINF